VVIDNILPSISSCGAAGNQAVNVDAGQCNYTKTGIGWNAIGTDNCGSVNMNYLLTGATQGSGTSLAGVSFNLGLTTVMWTVSDNNGNNSTCSYTVQVNDIQAPLLSNCVGSEPLQMTTDPGMCNFTQPNASLDPIATDNCTTLSGACTLSGATSGTYGTLSGVSFNIGTTNVQWTFTDQSGNSAMCHYTIMVSDNEPPVIANCPSDIQINAATGLCGRLITWAVPTARDNCQVTMTSTIQSGTFFPIGSTVVLYTATDASGNQAHCSFVVTVTDLEAPSIICSGDISSCDPTVTYANPSATDNCDVSSLLMKTGLPSGSIFPIGTTIISFEATDINGNKSQCSFNVVVHPKPEGYISGTDVSCHGHNNGSADLSMTSGSTPFTYKWSNGQSSEDLTNLSAGSYSVSVLDAFGCSTTAQVTIQEPDAILLYADVEHVACHDGNTGTIDLTVSGGDDNYTYFWNDGQQTQDADSLSAGNYMVIVTDGKGCAASLSTALYQSDTLLLELTAIAATCSAANGSIQGSASGGTPPYDYSWSNGQKGMILNNAPAGTYTISVMDAKGCIANSIETIASVSDLQLSTLIENVSCYGTADGTARVVTENALAPYDIQWSNGDKGISADSLSAGTYTAYFTDANGCQDTVEITITQPDSLEAQFVISKTTNGYNITEHGSCNGWIEVITDGGVAEYSYLWSNGSSANYITDLCEGTYSIVITDANGCATSGSVSLMEPLVLEMPNGFSPNDDGDNDAFVVRGLDAYPVNELIIFNRWGNIVFQDENYQNDWQGENSQSEPLPDATYFVILKVTVPADGTITLTGYVDLRRN
jgi:gliding motility-associated-like protein